MNWSARRSGSLAPPLALAVSLALAAPAAALEIDFDDLAAGSDVATATLPGVSVSTALVLSETQVGILTGFPAQGKWATSGMNGLLNTLAPSITFTFDVPVTSFSIDVLSLEKDGVTLPIALEGFFDLTSLSLTEISDPALIGDSGLHEQRLTLTAPASSSFTRVTLQAVASCSGSPCISTQTSTFWLDSASFTPIPEPGTPMLLGEGFVLLAGLARGRRDRS